MPEEECFVTEGGRAEDTVICEQWEPGFTLILAGVNHEINIANEPEQAIAY